MYKNIFVTAEGKKLLRWSIVTDNVIRIVSKTRQCRTELYATPYCMTCGPDQLKKKIYIYLHKTHETCHSVTFHFMEIRLQMML